MGLIHFLNFRAELTRIKDEQDESSENHEIACELRKVMPGKLERKIIKQTVKIQFL